jgi:hypothetical protein
MAEVESASHSSSVIEWLTLCGLNEFQTHFSSEGYDDLDVIAEMTAKDIEDLGISKKGHVKKILLSIEDLRKNLREKRIQQRLAPPTKKRLVQSDIDHCERGVKEISLIEEIVLKEKSEVRRNYEMLFDKKGQQCKPWAKEQRQYYETLLENLNFLLDTTEDTKSKLSLNLSTSKKAFAAIASRKKSSLVKRRKQEKDKGAKKGKRRICCETSTGTTC